MRFTEQQLAILDAIAAGLPVRNSREVVAAMRLKSDFLLSKPASAVDHRMGIMLVENPYGPEAEGLKPASPVAVAALPPAEEGQASAAEEDKDEENQA
jgi:hypothetical protein